MSARSFSKRTVAVLAGLCAISLLVGLGLAIFQEELTVVRSTGSDTFSYSALGHHAFKALLEDLGYPVLASRNNSAEKVGYEGVLVLAEPDLVTLGRQRSDKFRELCETSEATLVVLPKRRGSPDTGRPTFLGSVSDQSPLNSQAILEALDIQSDLIRRNHSRSMHWNAGRWADRPFIDHIQLIQADNVEPLIACSEGTLLGQLRITESSFVDYWHLGDILILSDPDLLENHGLGQGNNAAIAVKIIDYLRGGQGAVVFDETLHGHEVSPSVFRSFFRIPLVFVLLQVLLTGAAFLWLANGRFGSPQPAPEARGRGLDYLIDNTAELLEFGGHGPFVLGRYYRAALGSVCRRLHLELPRTSANARSRLVNITHMRSPEFNFGKMDKEISSVARDSSSRPPQVLALARAIHRWQQEMTHGL